MVLGSSFGPYPEALASSTLTPRNTPTTDDLLYSGAPEDWDYDAFEDMSHPPRRNREGDEPLPPVKRALAAGSGKARLHDLRQALQGEISFDFSGIFGGAGAACRARPPAPVAVQEVLRCRCATLKHIPGAARPAVQRAFAASLVELSEKKDTLALWKVLAFPKLVLRETGDPKAHPGHYSGKIVLRRLDLWIDERYGDLWNETARETAIAEKKKSKAQGHNTGQSEIGDVNIT